MKLFQQYLLAVLVLTSIASYSYSQADSDAHRLDAIVDSGGPLGNLQSGHLFNFYDADGDQQQGPLGFHGVYGFNNNTAIADETALDPEERTQSMNDRIFGGAPSSRYFLASYITEPTTTFPIPVTPNGQSFWLDVDSSVTGGDPFASTGAVEVYGSAYPFSDSIQRATFAWKKLRYTERNAFAADAVAAASTGYVVSATGNYHYNVQGLKYLLILADDIGSVSAVIGGTLTNYSP